MPDILITGASGMLGRALMREFDRYNPVGTAFSRVKDGLLPLNLLDVEAVKATLHAQRPRIIIHAAAERRPEVGEKDPAGTTALNVEATRTLARIAREIGAFVLYISTDYVFDGLAPPYKPGDATNPLNLYGKTKLAGEQALFAELPQAAVLRVGVLFGTVETAEESAVTALIKDVRSATPKAIDDWGRRYPTYSPDVALLCRQIVEAQERSGLWHWCGNQQYSKYEQALLIGSILGLSTSHLTPDPNPPLGAPRPRDCRLDCSRAEQAGLGRRTLFQAALAVALRDSGLYEQ